jgi:toxin ParE1/3/4
MRVRYTLRARADLESIHAYIAERAPTAARAVLAEIQRSIARLATFPLIARPTDEPGIHELTLVRYPYKIYYEVADGEVRILHVRDGRRHPWTRKGEVGPGAG